jgi:hypothetical protein
LLNKQGVIDEINEEIKIKKFLEVNENEKCFCGNTLPRAKITLGILRIFIFT